MINTGTAKSSTVHDLISTVTYILIQSSIQLCSMIKTALYCTPVHNCSKLCRDIQCYTHCTGYPSADIRYPATPDIWFVVKRDIWPAKYPEKSLHLISKKLPNPLIKNGQIQWSILLHQAVLRSSHLFGQLRQPMSWSRLQLQPNWDGYGTGSDLTGSALTKKGGSKQLRLQLQALKFEIFSSNKVYLFYSVLKHV